MQSRPSKARAIFTWVAAVGFALSLYVHFEAGCASSLHVPKADSWGAIVIAVPSVAIAVLLIASGVKTPRLLAMLLFITLPITSFWGAAFFMGFAEERGQQYCNR